MNEVGIKIFHGSLIKNGVSCIITLRCKPKKPTLCWTFNHTLYMYRRHGEIYNPFIQDFCCFIFYVILFDSKILIIFCIIFCSLQADVQLVIQSCGESCGKKVRPIRQLLEKWEASWGMLFQERSFLSSPYGGCITYCTGEIRSTQDENIL